MSVEVSATAAVGSQSLAELYAQWCGKEGCRANSALLRHLAAYQTPRALEQLSLRNNYLGPRGLRPVLRLIEACQAIHTLDLEGNGVDNATVQDLCAVLVQHLSLRCLNLARNPISLLGGRALLELLERAPAVVAVEVSGTDIPAALQERIAAAVALNRRRLGGSQPQLVPLDAGVTAELRRDGASQAAHRVAAVRTRKAALDLLHHATDQPTNTTAMTWHAGQCDRSAAVPTREDDAVWLTTQKVERGAGTARLTAPQPRPPLPALASQHTAAPPLQQINELAVAFAERSRLNPTDNEGNDDAREGGEGKPVEVHDADELCVSTEEHESAAMTTPAPSIPAGEDAVSQTGNDDASSPVVKEVEGEATPNEEQQHAVTVEEHNEECVVAHTTEESTPAGDDATVDAMIVTQQRQQGSSENGEGSAIDDLLQPGRCVGMSTEERFEALFDAGCTAYGTHDLDTAYMAWNEAMRIAVARKNREWMAVLSSNLQRLSYELLVQEGNAHLAKGELEAADDNFATALEVAVRARQAQWQSAMHSARREVQNAVFHRCHEAALGIFNKAQQLTPQPVTEQDVFVVPGTDILVRHSAAFVFQWSWLLLVQEALRTWCEAARLAQRMGGTAATVRLELVRDAVNTVACFLLERLVDATEPAVGLSGQHTDEYHYHECIQLAELWADMSAYSEQHLQHPLFAAVAAAQLGNLYLATNQLAMAERQFERVVTSATSINVPVLRATGLTFAGVVHWQRANYALAERHLQEAIAIWQELAQEQLKQGQKTLTNTDSHAAVASPSATTTPAEPYAQGENALVVVAQDENTNEGSGEMKATSEAGMQEQLRRAIPVGYVDLMNYTAHMYLVDTLAGTFRYRDALEALERGLTRLHRDLLLVKTRSNFTLSPTLEQIAAIAHELRSPLVYYFLHKRYEWNETGAMYDVEESIFVWVVAPCKEMRFVELNVSKDYKTSMTALLAQVRTGWHLDPLHENSHNTPEMITTLPHATWMNPLRVLYAVLMDPILDFVRALSPAAQSLGGTDDMCDTLLTLIPTGPLWLIPFNALIHTNTTNSTSEEGGWHYLVEEAAVQLAFSATQCAFSALSARRVRQRRRYRDVVVIQAETDPTAATMADVQSVFGFDVARARAEGAAVVSTWQAIRSRLVSAASGEARAISANAVVLSNSEKTIEELDELRTALPQARTVHVASAVVTVPTSAAAVHNEAGTSAIATAAPLPACATRPYEGAICTTVAHHDLGLLRASEVERMELLAELVVLSDTNMHVERVRGAQDGLHNLLRAFFSAGVPCVMAGQWCTPDMVPSELFCAFYRRYYNEGVNDNEEDENSNGAGANADDVCGPLGEESRGAATQPAGRPGMTTEGKVYVQLSSAGPVQGTRASEETTTMMMTAGRGPVPHKALALAHAMRHLLNDGALRYNPRAWAGYYCIGSGLL